MKRKLLIGATSELGLRISDAQIHACEQLLQELSRWNKRINLTAITKPEEMTVKHLVDSLQLVPLLTEGARVLDIGSGAGFPAIVLAIMRPDCQISSIDAVSKKISFQKHVGRLLQLENLLPRHGRVEELAQMQPDYFDLVTSRAFSSLEQFCRLAYPLTRSGGRILSMRSGGGVHELRQLQTGLELLGLSPEQTLTYSLPLNLGQRSLIILRKTR